MARKKQEEQKAGAPEWLATYGDMMTLLLVFFVMLFSMSSIDSQSYAAASQSIVSSFGFLDASTKISLEPLVDNYPNDSPTEVPSEYEELSDMQEEIQKILEDDELSGMVKLEINERGLLIRFLDSVLFDSGSADLTPKATKIIDEISSIIEDTNKKVTVEGHTDNLPINTYKFPSNWELSTARAVNVVKYLIDKNGIDPIRLSASGYADQHPISENSTSEGRRNNRRVDMVILRSEKD